MFTSIIKRDGREVPYDIMKVANAINKAMEASGRKSGEEGLHLAKLVEQSLSERFQDTPPGVEDIQDSVENVLMQNGYAFVSKKYIIYRAQRNRAREMNTNLMRIYNEITFADARESDLKRDNANVDGDTAMGTMLKYGSEGAKDFYEKYILSPEQSKAHREGDIHIHDFDFYSLTTTCCQIDLNQLFSGGFSTGHGFLREPNDILSYAALACIAIQSNQNDQHGGQSVPNFDYALALGVAKSFKKLYRENLIKSTELLMPELADIDSKIKQALKDLEEKGLSPAIDMDPAYCEAEKSALAGLSINGGMYEKNS